MNGIENRISGLSAEKRLLLEQMLEQRRYKKRTCPLPHAQQRLWVTGQMYPEDTSNHILSVNRITGDLNPDYLAASLREIVMRHEALRTYFQEDSDSGHQVIASEMELPFQQICLIDKGENDPEERAIGMIVNDFHTPFCLSELPLFRVCLYQTAKDQYLLSFVIHHIVFDGWSTDILAREVLMVYRQKAEGSQPSLPILNYQYQDYARLQNDLKYEEHIQKQLNYWTQQLSGASHTINFPYDYARPAVDFHQGKQHALLDKERTRTLRAFCLKERSTTFMAMLSVCQILLEQYTGEQDIVLGVPVAGRNDVRFESLIGFFVNVLPMRLKSKEDDPSFREILREVSKTAIDAYANQDASYGSAS